MTNRRRVLVGVACVCLACTGWVAHEYYVSWRWLRCIEIHGIATSKSRMNKSDSWIWESEVVEVFCLTFEREGKREVAALPVLRMARVSTDASRRLMARILKDGESLEPYQIIEIGESVARSLAFEDADLRRTMQKFLLGASSVVDEDRADALVALVGLWRDAGVEVEWLRESLRARSQVVDQSLMSRGMQALR